MTINQLAEKRKRWVEANRENDFEDGIKNLLTDLYPDNAHFTYELLQNAEDAGASEVQFILNTDGLEFEHNGDCLFTIEDITSITSIGDSTKRDDPISIGKFGIGFKAVFAYTATPEIESGPFHFRIRDMVVPDTVGLDPGSLGEKRTRFVFPFDNPEKSSEKARAEIETKLRHLNETTLLFLNNIRRIEYRLSDSMTGSLERRKNENDESQIEIAVTRPGNIVPDSTHYLRFQQEVDVRDEDTGELKCCQIAVAFGMDKPRNQNGKIVPLNPGQVCIYFPAESETSKLRFHLHAPFASTVARASARRNSAANEELRDHLADLVAESIGAIRDKGLLDVEFLATLPNNSDDLSPFYLPIQERLIKEFKSERLVPVAKGGYTVSSECYRDQGNLSDLIGDVDLATFLEKEKSQPLWLKNPPPPRRDEKGQFVRDERARQQNERISDFLTMLGISEWTIEDLIEVLDAQSDLVVGWLKGKQDVWHQSLYVLLGDFLSGAPSNPFYIARERKEKLSNLCIIRCSDGEYRVGNDCHFIDDGVEPDDNLQNNFTVLTEGSPSESQDEEIYEENFHYVASNTYSSASNRNQQEKARKFLETIGVRRVDDVERVKVILKQRYKKGSIKPREEDMEKFMTLVEGQPEYKSLFSDYFIFEVDLDRDDSKWFMKPTGVFLDSPYLATGLTAYHEALGEDSDSFKRALSPKYVESGIDLKRFGEFAEIVGAQTKLDIDDQPVFSEHPEYEDLVTRAPGQYRTDTYTSEDHIITEIKILLEMPSVDKSKLIWQTMTDTSSADHLEARYRKNQSQPYRVRASSLVHELRNAKWIPQKNGNSFSFVQPCDASIERLPEGFIHKTGQKWLDAIEFGKTANRLREESTQRDQQAKDDGFASLQEKEQFVEFAQRLRKEGRSINDVISQYSSQNREAEPNFPTSTVKNPKLRKERVLEQVRNAPKKRHEARERKDRVSKSEIDQRTTLQEWYTNDSGEMICQICKEEMPFKKNDGEYYFIAVEALTTRFKDDELPENHFPKEYESQYLALCPECAARYDYFVRDVKEGIEIMDKLRDQLINSDNLMIPVRLGELETDLRFVEAHLHDLKEVLNYYENPQDDEESTD